MSLYGGSTSRLASMGQRSSSRPDLTSQSFRNDMFVGGNGVHGDYQAGDGGFTHTSTFTRTSMHGGGYGGGQKVQVSMGGGGGGGGIR